MRSLASQRDPARNNARPHVNVSRPTLTLALDDVRSLETFWPAHVNVAPFQTTWVLRLCKAQQILSKAVAARRVAVAMPTARRGGDLQRRRVGAARVDFACKKVS